MAPWNTLFGGGGNTDLPESIPARSGGANSESAFVVFIDGALTNIYNEAGGRSKDSKAIRESCKAVLGKTSFPLHRCLP